MQKNDKTLSLSDKNVKMPHCIKSTLIILPNDLAIKMEILLECVRAHKDRNRYFITIISVSLENRSLFGNSQLQSSKFQTVIFLGYRFT